MQPDPDQMSRDTAQAQYSGYKCASDFGALGFAGINDVIAQREPVLAGYKHFRKGRLGP